MWCDGMWGWCDMMWCDVMWGWWDEMWCDVMWFDLMWCDVMWCDGTSIHAMLMISHEISWWDISVVQVSMLCQWYLAKLVGEIYLCTNDECDTSESVIDVFRISNKSILVIPVSQVIPVVPASQVIPVIPVSEVIPVIPESQVIPLIPVSQVIPVSKWFQWFQ